MKNDAQGNPVCGVRHTVLGVHSGPNDSISRGMQRDIQDESHRNLDCEHSEAVALRWQQTLKPSLEKQCHGQTAVERQRTG